MDTGEPTGGRPFDAGMTERILEEARRSLGADGFSAMRIERIAAAVGCGKAAIYRRWPNKAELVAAAVSSEILSETDAAASDTGEVGEDLLQHVLQSSRRYRTVPTTGAGIGWAALGERDVVKILWQGPLGKRRQLGLEILERGIGRGQLPPETDCNLILDLLAGMSMYRYKVRDEPPDISHYRASIDSLLASPPLIRAAERPADVVAAF
ncbi:TetR/AcrR family transcriptional regulator [Arthrobacter sp. AZCC_0090]|uniref:TetR/AcrR family transcriptional regulator n=1 Tax=Arthrobacter sp. AZCC_0090 TaxID=2735881 RepID=UPI00160B8254|nr:TetR/AcrR family transcriptional regulator [Arthrobacter sp. AZCC_0090]MBB6403036.1 AcrR family transcriptional regulator [Arthrobacter sp. AZCC_0090]